MIILFRFLQLLQLMETTRDAVLLLSRTDVFAALYLSTLAGWAMASLQMMTAVSITLCGAIWLIAFQLEAAKH